MLDKDIATCDNNRVYYTIIILFLEFKSRLSFNNCVYMHFLLPYIPIYHIAGNIGGELNLADWRFYKHTAKFKSANYFSSTNVTSCNLVGLITAKLISANFDFSPFLSNPPN